jgi:hypothetical protein
MALPTSVITQASYRLIAVDYANARTSILASVNYFLDAVQQIVDSDYIEPNIDLLATFYNTYLSVYSELTPDNRYFSSVSKINGHVLARSGYSDVNDYLEDATNPITVPQAWADLCSETNVTIDPGNIG